MSNNVERGPSIAETIISGSVDTAAKTARALLFTTFPDCVSHKSPLKNNPADLIDEVEGHEKSTQVASSAKKAAQDSFDTLSNLEDTGSSCPASKKTGLVLDAPERGSLKPGTKPARASLDHITFPPLKWA